MTSDTSALMTAEQVVEAMRLRRSAIDDCLRRQRVALEPLDVEQDDLNRRFGEINSRYHKESDRLRQSLSDLEQQLADIQENCSHLGQAINIRSPERAVEYIFPDKRRMAIRIRERYSSTLPATRSRGQCSDCLLEQLVVCPVCSGLVGDSDSQEVSVQQFDISWWRDAPNRGSQLIDGVDQQFVALFGLEETPKTLDEFVTAKTVCEMVTWLDGKPSQPSLDSQMLFIWFYDESGVRIDVYETECPRCSIQLSEAIMSPYVNWSPM